MLALWGVALIISFIGCEDQLTWVMEVVPAVIAGMVLLYTNDRFPLPRYIMIWIFIHGLVLIMGGHYTYAKVPMGFWLQDVFHFARNPYDRIGHFFQGFVPALVAREVLVRHVGVKKVGWCFFLTVVIAMGISVTYEFIEWAAAILMNQSAEAFLGTQGDIWDTQWDMLLATIGAIVALIIYRRKP